MTKSSTPRLRAAFAAMLLAGTTLGGVAFWHGDSVQAQTRAQAAIAPPATTQAALPGFADLVARVRKSVVTITTTERAAMRESESPFPPGGPRDKMFRRYFGDGDTARGPVHALGSGFIVDAEGHVVTNNHVVQGASAVKVTLDDGRELNARVVGRDPRTDVALLKVDAGEPLPYLELGDSDRARPGDWVVAVGNPFGLGGTVTAGVVSARSRDIGQGPYDDFIQIDAPINRGNSGGPLFALDGSVIGVNTAIFSPTGGSVGIGFAIPSNMVRRVVAQLEANGSVARGFLGATTQKLTPDLAKAMNLPKGQGALVAEVSPDGPAQHSGLRAGDVVTAVDGRAITDQRELSRSIAEIAPGTTVTLTVLRDGQAKELHATLAALPDEEPEKASVAAKATNNGPTGLALAPLTDAARQELKVPRTAHGAVVAAVRPESPAAEAGLEPGDVIIAVAGHDVENPAQAVQAIREGARAGSPVALRLLRGGQSLFVAVSPAKHS